jgi:dTDP-4-dehydrorhamnose 3,5-epimerase-like enzyme
MSIHECYTFEFPKIHDPRGNLTFIESNRQVPFEIKRVYYLYDVPGGATRAGHAHKALQQVLIAISGSFDVLLDDGKNQKTIHMNRSYSGLYILPLTWRVIDNFSSGAVCLSIVSDFYNEEDYIRDYSEFLKFIGDK